MKAVVVQKDGSLSWERVADPILKPDEVLIQIQFAGLNRADLMQREGNYPPPEGCPEWMGLEISGVIVQVGAEASKKSRWKAGDRICALLGGGGYAQYVSVRYDMLLPVPEGCTMAQAAALPEAFATAYLNLFIEGELHPGDTLLMQAAASGLGSVVIPMAKAFGIYVAAAVRSPEKAQAIRPLGADRVIVTSQEDIVQALQELGELGHPVDLALDCVGGEEMGRCLPLLNRGGRWIVIAALAGEWAEISLKTVYTRGLRIIGSTLRSRSPEVKAHILSRLAQEIWPLVEAGKILPTLYRVLPGEAVEEAQAILRRNENVGKVVLEIPLENCIRQP